ncbi:cytochrome c biogenesis CcdA family protein [Klenkia terrae]|uniref:cytochrome c biogenesis CcdA family protein n=1 Tax=Klenkia terrae TaxID=1052259 RepID=UPI00360D0B30
MTDLGDLFAGLITDGSLVIAIAVAALVGLISFASPCVLPLVPGYLGYVAGLSGTQTAAAASQADAPSVTTSVPVAAAGPAGRARAPGAPRSTDHRRRWPPVEAVCSPVQCCSWPASRSCSCPSGPPSAGWGACCSSGRRSSPG